MYAQTLRNRSACVYVTSDFAEVIAAFREAFPHHTVIENGPPSELHKDGPMVQTITVLRIETKLFTRGKQRKAIRDLKARGLIRNFN